MPPADQNHAENMLLRLLCYGPAKVKKTWWALKAAEAGFAVHLFDGDAGSQIISQIDKAALPKINVIDIVDKQLRPVMCEFMTRFLTGNSFMWDEEDKSILLRAASAEEDRSYYIFDVAKLTSNDVVVIDSWDALTWSLAWRWYKENNVKVESADQATKSMWDGYRWSGAMASWMLKQIKALTNQCHVIVIGHQSVYEKRKEEVINGKKVQTVEWSRLQVKSVSNPHSMELASAFTDILYFNIAGSRFSINTRVEQDRDGGCRVIAPNDYRWEELQFIDVIKMAGIREPDPDYISKAVTWYKTGSDLPEGKTILLGNEGKPLEAATVKPSVFSGLLAKKS